jgi:hypothetical protein
MERRKTGLRVELGGATGVGRGADVKKYKDQEDAGGHAP